MKLIYIEWQDAVYNAEWFTETEAEIWHDSTQYTIKECGWLVKEDKKGITLACRLRPEDNNTDTRYGGLQYIPKPWIIKRKKVEV